MQEKHPKFVEKYDGTMRELVEDIGNLRYDKLDDFFILLSEKIFNDSKADKDRDRIWLSSMLYNIGSSLNFCHLKMKKIWKICKSRMNME